MRYLVFLGTFFLLEPQHGRCNAEDIMYNKESPSANEEVEVIQHGTVVPNCS